MSILDILGCVSGVIALAFGGLLLYGACRNSAQEYTPEHRSII